MKECKKCFSEIDSRAIVCPICKSSINFFGSLKASDFIAFIVLGGFTLSLFILEYKKDHQKDGVVNLYQQLSANVLKINKYKAFEGTYVSCIGEISNPTNQDFYNLHYEVTFYNSEGALIDIANLSSDNVSVPANGKANFRTNAVATSPDAVYSKCNVKITSASNK